MRMRRHVRPVAAATAGAVLAALAVAAPGVAAPAPAGHVGGDEGNTRVGLGPAPTAPGVLWVADLVDLARPNDDHLVLDDQGHVLLQVRDGGSTTEQLVALDRTDGSVAWTADDVETSCGVVATDAGIVFGQLVPDSPPAPDDSFVAPIVGIDATDGSLVEGLRFDGPLGNSEGRIGICLDSLRLAPDDTLLVVESSDDQGNETGAIADLHAFDVTGPDGALGTDDDVIERRWTRTFDGLANERGVNRVVVSSDGTGVWVLHRTSQAPDVLALELVDLAAGTTTAAGPVPNDRSYNPGAGSQDGGLTTTPDGVLAITTDDAVSEGLTTVGHFSADGAVVTTDWTRTYDGREDDPDFPGPITTMAVDAERGQAVGFAGRRRVVALGLDDGAERWTSASLGSSNSNDAEITLDADGRAHVATLVGEIVQLDADGGLRWNSGDAETFLDDPDIGVPVALGPVDDDGVVYALFIHDGPYPTVVAIAPGAQRLSGDTRITTATTIAGSTFLDGGAGAVVLARSDNFADALAGTPFAAQEDAPLLLTAPTQLDAATESEIERVLPEGGTVYLLGGPAALDPAIENRLRTLGYVPVRIGGQSRFETAALIAQRMPDADTVLLTRAFDFPDALAAGPAAIASNAVILLTGNGEPNGTTDGYLAANPGSRRFAVGGPAARAYPTATPLVGDSRIETAVLVAERFFPEPTVVGFARSDTFADALAGGIHVGLAGGPMLLTPSDALAPASATWLEENPTLRGAYVYGGPVALSEAVLDAIDDRIG